MHIRLKHPGSVYRGRTRESGKSGDFPRIQSFFGALIYHIISTLGFPIVQTAVCRFQPFKPKSPIVKSLRT